MPTAYCLLISIFSMPSLPHALCSLPFSLWPFHFPLPTAHYILPSVFCLPFALYSFEKTIILWTLKPRVYGLHHLNEVIWIFKDVPIPTCLFTYFPMTVPHLQLWTWRIKQIKPMLEKLRIQAHFWIKPDLYDAILSEMGEAPLRWSVTFLFPYSFNPQSPLPTAYYLLHTAYCFPSALFASSCLLSHALCVPCALCLS